MNKTVLVLLSIVGTCFASSAINPTSIAKQLKETDCFRAQVRYEVLLPTSADPVVYSVNLLADNVADTLSPNRYLISWTLPRGEKISKGFASYFDGNHYRYRDSRLQEYHAEADISPFTAAGGGVQRSAQFADLLPGFIAERLEEMASDTTFISRFEEKSATLSGVQRISGYDAMEYTYRFDPVTSLPLELDFVYNPGGISEQTVSVQYSYDITPSPEPCPSLNEDYIIGLFPEEFRLFRLSTYRIENLRGSDFPHFVYSRAGVSAGGERMNHQRGQADLGSSVLMVFLDPEVESNAQTLSDIRNACADIPVPVKIIYVLTNRNHDFEEALSSDEFVAAKAPSLITEAGVTVYPTIVILSADGSVMDVLVGTASDRAERIAQTLVLAQ